jgi:hypothetical protein
VQRLFDEVVAGDVLPKVLHRYGLVPAVIGTEDLTGPWDTPGSQRRVCTSDGRRVRLRWSYTFVPTGLFAAPLLRLFVTAQWAGYMSRCADRCVAPAEAG